MTGDIPTPISAIADDAVLGTGGTLSRQKLLARRDIASGEVYDASGLIRFVLGPEGQVVADIHGKLPGRGAWIAARRDAVETAIKQKAFARSFKGKVHVRDDLIDQIEAGLRAKCLGLLGMATRAGDLSVGFDQVQMSVRQDSPALRVEASDGSESGRSKVRVITKAVARELELAEPPVLGCFNRQALGAAVGREDLVHGIIRRGRMAKAVIASAVRLSGFIEIVPLDWPDRDHETAQIKPPENGD